MIYCRNCGTALKPETNFCTNCGTKISIVQNSSNESNFEKKQIEFQAKDEELTGNNKFFTNLFPIYIFLNIPLFYLNNGYEEISGILIFSAIVLIGYYVRRNKEKPFNILIKIVLVLQLVLVFSTIMMNLEHFFINFYSLLWATILILFLISILLLLVKGNKT